MQGFRVIFTADGEVTRADERESDSPEQDEQGQEPDETEESE